MSAVDEFIEHLENTHQRYLIEQLHQFLMTYPDIKGKIRFRVPFYDGNKWICYINPIKKNGVEVCFIRGFKLGIRPQLEARKRTMVKGISVFKIDEEILSLIADVFEEALALDKNGSY